MRPVLLFTQARMTSPDTAAGPATRPSGVADGSAAVAGNEAPASRQASTGTIARTRSRVIVTTSIR
jgi:hypothetical protein